jgi:hypothetical protein
MCSDQVAILLPRSVAQARVDAMQNGCQGDCYVRVRAGHMMVAHGRFQQHPRQHPACCPRAARKRAACGWAGVMSRA